MPEDVDSFTQMSLPVDCLLHAFNSLYHHGGRSTTTVANGGDAIFSWLQLVQQGGENSRTGATKRMADRDGATQEVHIGVLQTEDLRFSQ